MTPSTDSRVDGDMHGAVCCRTLRDFEAAGCRLS